MPRWLLRRVGTGAPQSEERLDLEQGWPARDFLPDARDYLLTEVRKRVQEQLAYISAQDVKTATIFTLSVVLLSASGLIGDFEIAFTAAGVLTALEFACALLTWSFAWLAYRESRVGSGVNISVFPRHYRNASEREMKDAALEALTLDFEQNLAIIEAKARWLSLAVYSLGGQALILVAVIVARST